MREKSEDCSRFPDKIHAGELNTVRSEASLIFSDCGKPVNIREPWPLAPSGVGQKGADFMELREAVKSGLDNLTNFEGRATRSEFWWYWAAIAVPAIILSLIFSSFIPLVGALIGLAATGLAFSAAVRRLHDSGRPGMWMVPFVVVTSLLTLVAFIALFSGAWVLALLASYVGAVIQIVVGLVVLYFLVQPSDTGSNRYGPPRA